jgi:hypothetical protein
LISPYVSPPEVATGSPSEPPVVASVLYCFAVVVLSASFLADVQPTVVTEIAAVIINATALLSFINNPPLKNHYFIYLIFRLITL